MPLIIMLCLLLLPSELNAAEPLPLRLAHAASNAEQVSNQLLSQPAGMLSAEDWLVLSEAQLRLRHKDAAMDAVSRALAATEQPYLQAQGYLLKAQIYGILYRDTVIAITQLERAELLLQNAEDSASLTLYSDVLQNFAQAYNQLGNIPRALPYAERSLALAIRQQQPSAELKAHITLGRLMLQNNAYSLAYQHLDQALTLANQLQDEDALASIHLRLGMAYRKIEYHTQALEHLQQAKVRYQQLQRPSSYTYTLIYIAETYLEDSQTAAEAADYLNEALTQARQQDDLLRVGIVTLGLGRLAVLQQDDEQALQYFNDALQLFRQQQVLTYLQETSLALADLLLQRQQYDQANQLLIELTPQIPQAAAYLRYRYHDLAARLFAQQGDWAQAYSSSQQANTLRFEQLSEQSKLQLDLINQGLQQAKSGTALQHELNEQQQLNSRQQQYLYLLLSIMVLLALALAAMVVLLRRRRQTAATAEQLRYNAGWHSFSQRIVQHSGKTQVSLQAYTLTGSQQLKLQYGEQRLQLVLQQFQQQLPADMVLASCLHDDVLWLAVNDSTAAQALQLPLLQQLQQLLPPHFSAQSLLSLHLPLSQLLEKPWLSMEISALREALWLSWALCAAQPGSKPWVLTLHCRQPRACEWRSSMVRQDLLNAIRLGSIELECNNTLLPATIADQLT